MTDNVALRDNKRTRKIRTLSWSTAPRSLEVLCIGLHIIYKHRSENFNKAIINHYRKDLNVKHIHPARREVVYEFEQKQRKHHRLANVPSNNILDYPELDYVMGNQHGSHTNKSSIFSHLVTTASQYGFIDSNTYKLTPMGIKAANFQLTPDDIVAQLLKMYVKIGPKHVGVFPFQMFIKLMDKFHHLSFNELSFMFGITKPQDIQNIEWVIGLYRSSLGFSHQHKTMKQKRALVKRLWNQNVLPLDKVSPSFRSLSRDYPDTFRRMLVRTGIFTSTYQDIEISPVALEKFHELTKYHFQLPPHNLESRQAPKWFGSTDTSFLPWNDSDIHKQSVKYKLQALWAKGLGNRIFYRTQARIRKAHPEELQQIEGNIDHRLEKFFMKRFLYKDARTPLVRQRILNRFYSIERGYITNRQAWLENNIARALLCAGKYTDMTVHIHWFGIAGYHFAPVRRAPENSGGVRIRFNSQYVCIKPTLLTGSKQINQYLPKLIKFTDKVTPKYRTSKIIYSLGVMPTIDNSTWRTCFNLLNDKNKTNPLTIVPITIANFALLMKYIYSHNLTLKDGKRFLFDIAKLGKSEPNWQMWRKDINARFLKFKVQLKAA